MILPDRNWRIYLSAQPVDFRKGINGLAALVEGSLGHDAFSGAIFIFRSKRADRLKMLVYDGTGMVLVYKILEGEKFVWPSPVEGVISLSNAELSVLFEGADWRRVRSVRSPRPQRIG